MRRPHATRTMDTNTNNQNEATPGNRHTPARLTRQHGAALVRKRQAPTPMPLCGSQTVQIALRRLGTSGGKG